MPLYEYQCDSCERRFEVIQRFSDLPIAVCPSCGGTVRKLVSSPAIRFKGTGFYKTDYAKKPVVEAGNKESEADKTDASASRDGGEKTSSQDSGDKTKTSTATSPSSTDSASSSAAAPPASASPKQS